VYRYAGPAAAAACPVLPYSRSRLAMAPARRRGMGATLQQANPEAGAIAAVAASTATSVVGTLVALSAVTGPVGAAIAGVIAAAYAIANLFGGCGDTCVEATNIANQAGQIIDQAYNQYMSAPVHYRSMQTAYLQLFDGTWNAMVKACDNPALGAAGQRCITDRQAGSCAYKTSPGGWKQSGSGWTYVEPGPNGSGSACWNSFIGRRDPVANDPTVVDDPGVSGLLSSITGGGGSSILGVPAPLAIGALALLGLAWWASE
jgi:hypothetical protein